MTSLLQINDQVRSTRNDTRVVSTLAEAIELLQGWILAERNSAIGSLWCSLFINGGTFRGDVSPRRWAVPARDHQPFWIAFNCTFTGEGYLCKSLSLYLLTSFPADIWFAKGCWSTDPFSHGFPGTDNEHDDRKRIWKHLKEESPVWVVIKWIRKPKESCWTLDIQDQPAKGAKCHTLRMQHGMGPTAQKSPARLRSSPIHRWSVH